jgi:low temperature requirement protein LtrA
MYTSHTLTNSQPHTHTLASSLSHTFTLSLWYKTLAQTYTTRFWQWLRTQHFLNRFDAEDVVFLLHLLVNLILMALVGMTIGDCAEIWENGSGDPCPVFSSK